MGCLLQLILQARKSCERYSFALWSCKTVPPANLFANVTNNDSVNPLVAIYKDTFMHGVIKTLSSAASVKTVLIRFFIVA